MSEWRVAQAESEPLDWHWEDCMSGRGAPGRLADKDSAHWAVSGRTG